MNEQPSRRGPRSASARLLTDADVVAVAEWLAGGSLDAARLEPRLRIALRPAR